MCIVLLTPGLPQQDVGAVRSCRQQMAAVLAAAAALGSQRPQDAGEASRLQSNWAELQAQARSYPGRDRMHLLARSLICAVVATACTLHPVWYFLLVLCIQYDLFSSSALGKKCCSLLMRCWLPTYNQEKFPDERSTLRQVAAALQGVAKPSHPAAEMCSQARLLWQGQAGACAARFSAVLADDRVAASGPETQSTGSGEEEPLIDAAAPLRMATRELRALLYGVLACEAPLPDMADSGRASWPPWEGEAFAVCVVDDVLRAAFLEQDGEVSAGVDPNSDVHPSAAQRRAQAALLDALAARVRARLVPVLAGALRLLAGRASDTPAQPPATDKLMTPWALEADKSSQEVSARDSAGSPRRYAGVSDARVSGEELELPSFFTAAAPEGAGGLLAFQLDPGAAASSAPTTTSNLGQSLGPPDAGDPMREEAAGSHIAGGSEFGEAGDGACFWMLSSLDLCSSFPFGVLFLALERLRGAGSRCAEALAACARAGGELGALEAAQRTVAGAAARAPQRARTLAVARAEWLREGALAVTGVLSGPPREVAAEVRNLLGSACRPCQPRVVLQIDMQTGRAGGRAPAAVPREIDAGVWRLCPARASGTW